jgi:hypothetical protein
MLLLLFIGCAEPDFTEDQVIEIPKEAYEWTCRDFEAYSEIDILAGVCNDFDYLEVSISLINNNFIEEDMYHEGGCWWSALITQDENCIEIEGISITTGSS